jgi:hypothetical protein
MFGARARLLGTLRLAAVVPRRLSTITRALSRLSSPAPSRTFACFSDRSLASRPSFSSVNYARRWLATQPPTATPSAAPSTAPSSTSSSASSTATPASSHSSAALRNSAPHANVNPSSSSAGSSESGSSGGTQRPRTRFTASKLLAYGLGALALGGTAWYWSFDADTRLQIRSAVRSGFPFL